MAMTLKDIRSKYPKYNSKSDEELADAIHRKFYSSLPKEKVYEKLGIPMEDLTSDNESKIASLIESKPMEMELTKGQEPKNKEADWRGLAADTIRSLGHALSGGIGFAERTPGNIKEIFSESSKHPISYPFHVAGQLAASLAEGAKGTYNLQHDLLSELGKRHIIPEWLEKYNEASPLSHIPEDTGVEHALGLESTKKSDELIRALPAFYGGGKLVAGGLGKVKKIASAPDLKQSIRETQAKVNHATSEAGKIFDSVEKEVEAKGISKVPIDNNIIKTSESFLAKTPANKDLINRAKTGDYRALRSLQADLRVKGEKALSSALSAENKMGEEILSTRDQINESIQHHLENKGSKELANDLNKARNDYKTIQETYFSTPALAKVFGKSQKVPKNPKTLLNEESTEMNKFMANHPEVKQALSKALTHEKRMKNLGKVAAVLGIGTTAEVGRRILGGK